MNVGPYLTTTQAAQVANMHPNTIRLALASQELHGLQRTAPKGRWLIDVDCLTAWRSGQRCPHQKRTMADRRPQVA